MTTRGNDYFPQRLMFPLADARGRVVGFQARKLREDDPLRGKYVNSPEGDLFHKSSILYGLHLAKTAIGKQDLAAVVEGNTDVIALRQAGFEPVVASMGTALTDRQLRELGRLTKKLYLCFDADAAGQEATLRGMELAVGQGFDVKVVTLPHGQDPADAPDGFGTGWRTPRATSSTAYGSRSSAPRDRQEGFVRAREVLAKAEDSPERQEALRLLADRLDLPRDTLAGLAPARGGRSRVGGEAPRLLDAGDRLERDVLAACVAHPSLVRGLAELSPDHFDSDVNRRFRDVARHGSRRSRSSPRSEPSSTRARRRRRSTSGPARSSSSGSASGSSSATSQGPISPGRPSSRRTWRRCVRRWRSSGLYVAELAQAARPPRPRRPRAAPRRGQCVQRPTESSVDEAERRRELLDGRVEVAREVVGHRLRRSVGHSS